VPAYGVLAVAAARAGVYPWTGLVAGAIIMALAVVVRQITAMRRITAYWSPTA
jgi:hypothetical protein